MMGTRLILTPKVSSPLGFVSWSPEAAQKLDPNPDWGLDQLSKELEEIASKIQSPGLPQNVCTPLRAHDVSWRNLSKVANFGRKSGTFVMRAFDSDSESDSDDSCENNQGTADNRILPETDGFQQKERKDSSPGSHLDVQRLGSEWDKSPLLPKTERIEAALLELERERLARVQEEIRQRMSTLEDAMKEEKQRTMSISIHLEKEAMVKFEMARRADKQDQRLIAEARDMHLSVLQRDHEQRSQVEERLIRREAAAEDARKRALAREKEMQMKARADAEAQAKQLAEAEREKAAAEVAKRKAKTDAAAAAALQRADAERKAKQEAEQKAQSLAIHEVTKSTAASVPKPRVSEDAAKLEDARLNKLMELQESYKHLATNPALKKDLKVYERQIIKHLQQLSATQEQVRKKSSDLIQTLQDPRGPPIQFMIVTFSAKPTVRAVVEFAGCGNSHHVVMSQCESQVQKLPSFAFALAQVVVNVASQVPFVMESVLAQLHQACLFTVPKYFVFTKSQFESDEAYYKALGYREEGGKLESTDDYVARMNAFVTFYAALSQTEVPGGVNPHDLSYAWAWCARFLNRIPANRVSASALEAFLKIAGYRLFQAYPKPFMKVLQVVVSEFLVSLKSHDDVDARAVVNRLETYLHTRQFMIQPEGKNMPVRDFSSEVGR